MHIFICNLSWVNFYDLKLYTIPVNIQDIEEIDRIAKIKSKLNLIKNKIHQGHWVWLFYNVEGSQKGSKPHHSFYITEFLIHMLALNMVFKYLDFPSIANHAGNETDSVGRREKKTGDICL